MRVHTLTCTYAYAYPNRYDSSDPALSLSKARCRWGTSSEHETVPTVLDSMEVQCTSFLHSTAAVRSLQISLNELDFTPLDPDYGYYADPTTVGFVDQLSPRGGVIDGGSVITVSGSGFDVLGETASFARCRWGSIYNSSTETQVSAVNETTIICPSAPLDEGLQNLSVAFNGQQFIATNLQLLVFRQPSGFTVVALNTSALGLGLSKPYTNLAGAPFDVPGAVAEVWLRGGGFFNFENVSTPLESRLLLCRWGGPGSPTTSPLLVEEDLVVCPAASLASTATVGIYVSLNGADFVDTGMHFKYYSQPSVFSVSRSEGASDHCGRFFDQRCATNLYPAGGVDSGGTSVTLFGDGFAAFDLQLELASCWWGTGATRSITNPTSMTPQRIVCPSPERGEAEREVSVRLALNGVHFVDTGHTYSYYTQPANFSSIYPTGGALATGTTVTIFGEGFSAFSSNASKVRCRWGLDTNGTLLLDALASNATMHETAATELRSDRVVCIAHPKESAGERQVYLSLNAVDFASTGLTYKYYEQLTGVVMEPTGGLVDGGTLVTLTGARFDSFFGKLNDTLCRWGNASDSSPVTIPVSVQPESMVCPSAPLPRGLTELSIALNSIDFANLTLFYRSYEAPTFETVGPTLGSSNGGVRVTITGIGFQRFAERASSCRCRWGESSAHTTVPVSLTDSVIVCSSAPREELSIDTIERLYVALNAADYSWTGYTFTFFVERVHNVSVNGGAAGGPVNGGTLVEVRGDGLAAVTHCRFGNGTASLVFSSSTNTTILCNASVVGDLNLPDGAQFSAAAALRATGGDVPLVGAQKGFLPILLSRDSSSFFFTAMVFYYYPEPGNFTSVYPGGGPLLNPTVVTIKGGGFLGFDALSDSTRCRFGGVESGGDVSTPFFISSSEMRCSAFPRTGAGTVELYVSLNMGADYHGTGRRYVYYEQPLLLRTGCLGATKGCLTTGPTTGANPVKLVGIGLNVFVDYPNARCRFSFAGGAYYDRIADSTDGDFLGTGMDGGSILENGNELYCVTPQADVAEKIVTQAWLILYLKTKTPWSSHLRRGRLV